MSALIGLQNPTISGSYGPYGNWPDNLSQSQKSANAGYKVANSVLSGINQSDKFQNVQYSQRYYTGLLFENEESQNSSVLLDKGSALAYSTEALKSYDKNKDGTVTANEFNNVFVDQISNHDNKAIGMPNPSSIKAGATVDLNGDGKIDAGEYTAYTIYQDGVSNYGYGSNWNGTTFNKDNVDGKIDANQAYRANQQLQHDPDIVKADLQNIYTSFGIEQAQKNFVMPLKEGEDPVVTPDPPITKPKNQDFMQLIMMLLMMMFSFGGQRQQQNYSNFGFNY